MGNDGILRRGRHETVETDTADDDQDDDDKDSEEPIVKKPTLEEDRGIFLMLWKTIWQYLFKNYSDESPNVESTTSPGVGPGQEISDDNSVDEKPSKLSLNHESLHYREIDILQKLFPQKDKVSLISTQ